jgi:hypothetical protein
MTSNLFTKIRPFAPPKEETSEEIRDLFHPIILSDQPPPLGSGTLALFEEAKQNVEDRIQGGDVPVPKGADVKIIPLGTASAVPTKYRNGELKVSWYKSSRVLSLPFQSPPHSSRYPTMETFFSTLVKAPGDSLLGNLVWKMAPQTFGTFFVILSVFSQAMCMGTTTWGWRKFLQNDER